MGDSETDEYRPVTILDVLGVDLCARAILDYVPVEELVRSERVSRRWQSAVLHHLRTCGDLSYEGFCYPYSYSYTPVLTINHRTISIDHFIHSFPLVRKTLDKWGPYIIKAISDIGKGRYLDIIVSKCPNLEQIEIVRSDYDKRRLLPSLIPIKKIKQLKQVVLQEFWSWSKKNKLDLVLGELFQDINCESITICHNNDNLTGSFLKLLRPDVLKALTLTWCDSLRVSNLLSAIDNLRKITRMELGGGNEGFLTDAYLLLTQMAQLEELTLIWFTYRNTISEGWIHAFSQLGNLKRLTMNVGSGAVTDAFLEVLARSCKNLEYLKILGSTDSITARGVTALCRRSSSARTTLHFPPWNVEDYASRFSDIKAMSLYKELEALGCFELTLEWLSVVCRDPHGWELPLNPAAEDHAKNLKLVILF